MHDSPVGPAGDWRKCVLVGRVEPLRVGMVGRGLVLVLVLAPGRAAKAEAGAGLDLIVGHLTAAVPGEAACSIACSCASPLPADHTADHGPGDVAICPACCCCCCR